MMVKKPVCPSSSVATDSFCRVTVTVLSPTAVEKHGTQWKAAKIPWTKSTFRLTSSTLYNKVKPNFCWTIFTTFFNVCFTCAILQVLKIQFKQSTTSWNLTCLIIRLSHDFQKANHFISSSCDPHIVWPLVWFFRYGVLFFLVFFFTFSRTVHRLVVSSFGHLEHPCSHQVFVGAVCWCVTPASLNTKQEQTHEHSTQPHLQTQLAYRAAQIKPTQLELLLLKR